MEKMTFVTPINCGQVKNLRITEYFIIYLDKNNKLKRAIPDFNEVLISKEDSLIDEAINSDRFGFFEIVSRKKIDKLSSPLFSIFVNDDGLISRHTEGEVKLDSLLIDTKRRETASKLLKKKK